MAEMTKCPVCGKSKATLLLRYCKNCGEEWCQSCALAGKGPYPKQINTSQCPYCRKYNCVEKIK